MRITVGIVEDNQNLALGLAEKLRLSEELSVLFIAHSGREMMQKMEQR